MDKETINKRIEELKKENDNANKQLQNLESAKSQLIQQALIRNGRILELEELLKELDKKE